MKNGITKKIFGYSAVVGLSLITSLGSVFAASTISRSLSPTSYTPGSDITVTITVTLDPAVLAYAVEEKAPFDWEITSSVEGVGIFPGTSVSNPTVIKFPIAYFDQGTTPTEPQFFTYKATPPPGATGPKEFSGIGSFNGVSITIGGTTSIAPPVDTTPPVVSITAPAGGATVTGSLSVTANASDNIAVAGVQFKVDGANIGTEDTTSPYSISWNSALVANGAHSITAVARDTAGNLTTSAAVSVTASNVDTTAPTVSLTAPAANTSVLGNAVVVSATANDNEGVAGVQFKLGGNNIGAEDTVSPFSISWNTTLTPNGNYTLTAVARDAAGNTTTSAGRAVTISNPLPNTAVRTVSVGTYVPGTPFTVTITVTPGPATLAYALEETTTTLPIDNWGISSINNTGNAVAGTIRWGIYYGTTPRVFTYVVTPPVGATGTKNFNGFVSFDGVSYEIIGTKSIAGPAGDSVQPTVQITSPANNATVSGPISIIANATDNVGVVGVQFKLDGVNIGAEDTTSPTYSFSWNTTQSTNGSHTLTAVARDAAGNMRTSAAIVVTVNNSAPTPNTGSSAEPGFLPFKNVMVINKDAGMTITYMLSDGTASSSAKSSAISGASLAAGSVALKVYDRLGNEVRTLGQASSTGTNTYQSVWDGRNSNGELVASGTYILVLNQGSKVFKRKVVVIK